MSRVSLDARKGGGYASSMNQNAPRPPRPFGELLTVSLTLTHDARWTCLALVAVGLVPGLLLELFLLPAGTTKETLRAALAAGRLAPLAAAAGVKLVDLLVRSFCGVAIIAALDARLREGDSSVAGSLASASASFLDYALALALTTLWIVGGMLLFAVPGVVLTALAARYEALVLGAAASAATGALVVAAAVILMLRYLLVPMAVLLDGRRGRAALSRSSQLFTAFSGKVAGNLLVVGACVLGIGYGAAVFVSLALGLSAAPEYVTLFASELAAGAVGVWGTAFLVLLFRDLSAVVPAPAAS